MSLVIDFDLRVIKNAPGSYRVTAQAPGSGLASGSLDWARLTAVEFRAQLERMSASNQALLREIGNTLFDALFSGQVCELFLGVYRQRIEPVEGAALRLRLDFDETAPEIATLPWELLAWNDTYLATQVKTLVTRQLLSLNYGSMKSLAVLGGLKALIVIPHGSGLATDEEERTITLALENARLPYDLLTGRVSIQRLDDALSASSYHILHFIGHGCFERDIDTTSRGLLRFNAAVAPADAQYDEEWVDEVQMQSLLGNHATIKLVVLNACKGAAVEGRRSGHGFIGMAPAILRAGVPAVVAMQDVVRDDAALQFAETFYRRLTVGTWAGQVDAAATLARNACHLKFPNDAGFSSPVLYLRSADGRIFNVGDSPSDIGTPAIQAVYNASALPDLPTELRTQTLANRRNELVDLLRHVRAHRATLVTGIGGIGKTTLVRALLEMAPAELPPSLWLDFCTEPDATLDSLLAKFAAYLNWPALLAYRTDQRLPGQDDLLRLTGRLFQLPPLWLVFDNLESLLDDDGHFRDAGVENFFQTLLTRQHSASLIATSRVPPKFRDSRALGAGLDKSSLELAGLGVPEGVSLLQESGLQEDARGMLTRVVADLGGHPLALRLLASEAQTWGLTELLADAGLWHGSIASFARRLFGRLRPAEQAFLTLFFVYRRPQPVAFLVTLAGGPQVGLPVVRSLVDRSLLNGHVAGVTRFYRLHPLAKELLEVEVYPEAHRAAHLAAYDHYRSLRLPLQARWQSLTDVTSLVEAHYHAIEAGEIAKAAAVLFDHALPDYLERWGAQDLLIMLSRQTLGQAPAGMPYVQYLTDLGYARLTTTTQDALTQAQLRRLIGKCARLLNDYPRALAACEAGIALLTTPDGERELARLLAESALTLYRLGNNREAAARCQRALALIAREADVESRIDAAGLYRNLGSALYGLGRFADAYEQHRLAYSIHSELGLTYRAYEDYDHMGVAQRNLGNYEEAIKYHEGALQHFQAAGQQSGIAGASLNLGVALHVLGRLDAAAIHYQVALQTFGDLGNVLGLVASCSNLGELNLDRGQHEDALSMLTQALRESEAVGEKEYRPAILVLLGQAHAFLGHAALAEDCLTEAVKLAEQTENRSALDTAQALLAKWVS